MDYSNNPVIQKLRSGELVKISAPMVRYSKLAFRQLVRKHGVDVAYTPMIISDCFVRSPIARDVELTTCATDRPLVVQFAANNAEDFAAAVAYVAPHVDAVDLNCGCPQRWAMSDGYGAQLLRHPELIADMVATATRRCPALPIAIKIRISATDLRETVELAQRAVRVGAAWVTVHGRTPKQRTEPVNYDAIRLVRETCDVPVVANGDICSLQDATAVRERTGVHGVMAARGLLSDPAMFDGADRQTVVREWVDCAVQTGTQFPCFHHHLMFMLNGVFSRSGRKRGVFSYM